MGKKDLQLKRIFSNKGMAASLIACANYRHGIVLDPNKLRPSIRNISPLGLTIKRTVGGRRTGLSQLISGMSTMTGTRIMVWSFSRMWIIPWPSGC